jgi:phospholipase/carboxylesterase
MRHENMGGLDARILGGDDGRGGGDGPVVVLLHGFGAPGDDLVVLGQVLDVPANVRFVFPEAPLVLPDFFGHSRAWWMLDTERLERELAAGKPSDRSAEVPEGLAEARDKLCAFLDELPSHLGGACDQVILGGFSQGSVLACDIACTTTRPLTALVLMSSTLISAATWLPGMPRRAGMPIFQSHGWRDHLLSFGAAERLRDHLRDAGLDVAWHEFDGGHEIPPEVLAELSAFLRNVTRK